MNSWQQPVSGEPSVGTLHLIPYDSRHATWFYSGSPSSFTDVNFSSYVPSGVKALLLKYAIEWTGDGSADYSGWEIRQNGSSETDYGPLDAVCDYQTNLASGITRQTYGQITVPCDSSGIIEVRKYQGEAAVPGAIYLNVIGYYI